MLYYRLVVYAIFISIFCSSYGPSSDLRPKTCPFDPLITENQTSIRWVPSHGWDIFAPNENEKQLIESNATRYKEVKNRSLSVWQSDYADVSSELLTLSLSKCPYSSRCQSQGREHEYIGGELTSEKSYESGRYEAIFQAVKGSGVVTSLFTYRQLEGEVLNEIDVEILGKDTTEIHLTYWVGEKSHSRVIRRDILGADFDAALEPHTYAIEWDYQRIAWYVDDKCVHYVEKSDTNPFISHPMYLMLNLWVSNSGETWAGIVDDHVLFPTDATLHTAVYRNVDFYPGQVP